MAIIDGGGGDKSPKFGGKELFIEGGNKCEKICISGRAVVSGED